MAGAAAFKAPGKSEPRRSSHHNLEQFESGLGSSDHEASIPAGHTRRHESFVPAL